MRALAKCLLQFFCEAASRVLTRYLALVNPRGDITKGQLSSAFRAEGGNTRERWIFLFFYFFLDVAPPNCQIPRLRDAEINGNKSRVTSRTDGRTDAGRWKRERGGGKKNGVL